MKQHIFESLSESDLIIDAIYNGGNSKNIGDDPITKLFHVEIWVDSDMQDLSKN